ncbi:terminase family protein [Leisingera sp. MMG026]|uniref:terminase large subunit domain-containing protein n=1 Tax=Leisingera sp. MMG026 TaxID=2909982 RepID=UPI001F2D0216|nr:terminase family protein [Leisingera sp. MMG026]MCF6432655.1 terminase family protein [Leisingera sp. MMG026]
MVDQPKNHKIGSEAPGAVESTSPHPSPGKGDKAAQGVAPGVSGTSKRRGRPAKYTDAQKEQALAEYLAGDSTSEIAGRIGCSDRTVREWVKAGDWSAELRNRRETTQGLEAQILRLTRVKNPSNAQAQRLAMLSKTLERMQKNAPKPKPRPKVARAVCETALAQVTDQEYGLYEYQREFLESEERFRIILKARQIGFSYVVGLAVLLGAMAGRPQIVVSASERQAQIILNYVRHHAERLEVLLEEDKANKITVMGSDIVAVSTNFRTAQGWPGDVWLDEFAWVRNQRMLWAAVIPSITAIGGRVTVFSTPFLPGSLFWEVATNHKNKHNHWWRRTYTIEDAIAQGMPLPGGLDELRMLFDSESWAMFYECQWAENGSALLSWELLHSLTSERIIRDNFGRLRGGIDVGRINDRTAIALVGQEADGKKWKDRFALIHQEMHKGLPFDAQKGRIHEVDGRFDIESWKIDKTGMGMQLAEELHRGAPERFEGVWFSAQRKAKLALNMLKLAEERRLLLPNDPDVLAQLHSIQKIASGTTIKYDAERNDDGHGDLFWAVALAADGRAKPGGGAGGLGVEVLS